MLFQPFKYYSAGLSPVAYYKVALLFEHNFNIVISDISVDGNIYQIIGNIFDSGALFTTVITKNFNGLCPGEDRQQSCHSTTGLCPGEDRLQSWRSNPELCSREDEGDFTMEYDGIIYRIETMIDSKYDLEVEKRKSNTDPVNTIDLDIPKNIIKMAMIVLHLEI